MLQNPRITNQSPATSTAISPLKVEFSVITGLPSPTTTLPLWLPMGVAWFDEVCLGSFGKTPSVPLDGVRMSRQAMYYDSSKAVQELGLPQSPLDIALADAVKWFKEHLQA